MDALYPGAILETAQTLEMVAGRNLQLVLVPEDAMKIAQWLKELRELRARAKTEEGLSVEVYYSENFRHVNVPVLSVSHGAKTSVQIKAPYT